LRQKQDSSVIHDLGLVADDSRINRKVIDFASWYKTKAKCCNFHNKISSNCIESIKSISWQDYKKRAFSKIKIRYRDPISLKNALKISEKPLKRLSSQRLFHSF